jgi:hypothetical protein
LERTTPFETSFLNQYFKRMIIVDNVCFNQVGGTLYAFNAANPKLIDA